jgi:hypothetical protein
MNNVPVELVSTLVAVILMKELYLKVFRSSVKLMFGTTLIIYMKSGNKIMLPFISKYNFGVEGESITYIRIERIWWLEWLSHQKLSVATINLSQIEAVCVK